MITLMIIINNEDKFVPKMKFKAMLDNFDADGNGFIDADELKLVITDREGRQLSRERSELLQKPRGLRLPGMLSRGGVLRPRRSAPR